MRVPLGLFAVAVANNHADARQRLRPLLLIVQSEVVRVGKSEAQLP